MSKNFLFIIPPQDFRDEELLVPAKILERAGVEVTVASTKKGLCQGAGGAEVKSQKTIDEIRVEDFDGVAFIGGTGMVEMVDDASFKKLAQEFFEEKKLVAAICVAPMILANAGILKEVSATVWQGNISELSQAGADYSAKPVVAAGRIITADGPIAAKEFGQRIIKYLEEDE